MTPLSPIEARVLGVLIEKAQTTPEQYPLSLNAAVNGCNQKNNRDPVTSYTEDQCFEALEGLRAKGLVVRVDQVGSRVPKYKHQAIETLQVRTSALVILAELLMRGPQTLGELRGRASRMHPLESLEIVRDMLRSLMERSDPLVKELPPSPGSRAERYVQLLAPDAHPIDATPAPAPVSATSTAQSTDLVQRIERLEQEVAELRTHLQRLSISLGETDPNATDAIGT